MRGSSRKGKSEMRERKKERRDGGMEGGGTNVSFMG